MTDKEVVEVLERMWEVLFEEMRSSTFEELQESGELEKFRKVHDRVVKLYSHDFKAEGHWIRGKYTHDDYRYNDSSYKCSECGGISDVEKKYCPYCGRYMKE